MVFGLRYGAERRQNNIFYDEVVHEISSRPLRRRLKISFSGLRWRIFQFRSSPARDLFYQSLI